MATKQTPTNAAASEQPASQMADTAQSLPPRDNMIVPASQVQALWDSANPNSHACELFSAWLSAESAAHERNLNEWDELQKRFEPDELKWISDFVVDCLVFAKSPNQLGLGDESASKVVHLLWKVLDLFSDNDSDELKPHLQSRYAML